MKRTMSLGNMRASNYHMITSRAAILIGLATPAVVAQSGRNTTTCGVNQVVGIQEGGFYHNASANETFPVHGSGDWRLTLTLSEQREDEYRIDPRGSADFPILNYWLSVPETFLNTSEVEETTTSVCIYPLVGRNYSSDGGDSHSNDLGFSSHGCSGVLSDECLMALRDMAPAPAGSRTCPTQNRETTEACGFGGSIRPTGPRNFSDSAVCESAQIPGVDFPKDTRLYDLWSFYYSRLDQSADPDENYDLYLRQSFSVFLTFNTWTPGGEVARLDRIVTCLSPGENIVQGSRQPEGEDFPSRDDSKDDDGDGGNGGSEDSNDDDSGAIGRRLSGLALLPIVLALVHL